jgi:long-chain acyl-CoA synthetase
VLVPLMLSAILKTAEAKGLHFPLVQMVITGGAKLEPALRDRISNVFPQAEIVEYYGALELSFVSVRSSREAAPATSIGRPFHSVEVSVRRDDGTGVAAIDEIGWIGVRSELVCLGYLENDGSGLRILDGWATVGDRGWQDADGYLHLIGREDDMIVTGGVNVYPSEVESVLCEWPEIDEVAVLGIPNGDRGEAVTAVICWNTQPLLRADLLQRLRLSLPDYKRPRHLFTTRKFPRTPSGKIIRPELRQWIVSQQYIEPVS